MAGNQIKYMFLSQCLGPPDSETVINYWVHCYSDIGS